MISSEIITPEALTTAVEITKMPRDYFEIAVNAGVVKLAVFAGWFLGIGLEKHKEYKKKKRILKAVLLEIENGHHSLLQTVEQANSDWEENKKGLKDGSGFINDTLVILYTPTVFYKYEDYLYEIIDPTLIRRIKNIYTLIENNVGKYCFYMKKLDGKNMENRKVLLNLKVIIDELLLNLYSLELITSLEWSKEEIKEFSDKVVAANGEIKKKREKVFEDLYVSKS